MGSERLVIATEYDRKTGRWVATFEGLASKYLGIGPDERSAVEDLWKDRNDRLGIVPQGPPASWVHEDQLKDPVYMMNHQAEAAESIRQGRVIYEDRPTSGPVEGPPDEDHLG